MEKYRKRRELQKPLMLHKSECEKVTSPPSNLSSLQNLAQAGVGSCSSLHALRPQAPHLTPTLANHYRDDLVNHVRGWPADALEKQAQKLSEEGHTMGSLQCTRVSADLKTARSIVRLTEIQATLQEQRSLPSKETLRGHSDRSFRGEGYIQCCVGVRLCDMYSNQELAEIHFMYDKADGNAALARRLYQERYPQRQCPDRKTFVRLHYRLCEYGKFNSPGLGRGRPRSTTPEVQEEILEAVNMTPSISTRRVALQVNVRHATVWRLLKEYQLYPYHLQCVQALSPADYPAQVRFCSSAVRPQHVGGIIGDRLVGPHVLVNRLTGQAYTNFLENTIPHVLEDTPLINRQHIHFLHDGAPAHFSRTARRYLDRRFPNRWIGRGGRIAWPSRSPDLNPLDFYLWGHLKSLVYSSPVPDLESLRNRIVACSEDIRNTPGVWDRVRRESGRTAVRVILDLYVFMYWQRDQKCSCNRNKFQHYACNNVHYASHHYWYRSSDTSRNQTDGSPRFQIGTIWRSQKWKTCQLNSFARAASVQFGKVRTVSIATTISSDFVARILIIFILSLILGVG
ncbi:hypothetical protein ANN_20197 [Periplaneta americana]|uniref:DUF4817 domain-containing protein n=1 Tax=Periplaneta americana TaxID=6978 RepID=A0ABQ8SC84_PERAM|nr:hypothetical protein ANN_20197 [Periplaneta americana]